MCLTRNHAIPRNTHGGNSEVSSVINRTGTYKNKRVKEEDNEAAWADGIDVGDAEGRKNLQAQGKEYPSTGGSANPKRKGKQTKDEARIATCPLSPAVPSLGDGGGVRLK